MAIYHMSVRIAQRAKGKTATGKAAYIASEKVHDERLGITHKAYARDDLVYTEIVTPCNTKFTTEKLWNLAEQNEKRKDANTAREIEIALPKELKLNEQIELTKKYVSQIVEQEKCAVQYAIHNKEGNPHAHILCTTREMEQGKLTKKCNVELGDRDRAKQGLASRKATLKAKRLEWEVTCNEYLKEKGYEINISSKTLEEQSINRIPQIHLGSAVIRAVARGEKSRVWELNELIKKYNILFEYVEKYNEQQKQLEKPEPIEIPELQNILKQVKEVVNNQKIEGAKEKTYSQNEMAFIENLMSPNEYQKYLQKLEQLKFEQAEKRLKEKQQQKQRERERGPSLR